MKNHEAALVRSEGQWQLIENSELRRTKAALEQEIAHRKRAEKRLREALDFQQRVASTLQQSLMHPVPEIPGLEIAVAYRAAVEAEKVGGDFYDVFRTRSGEVAVLVGDVSGKGIEAAGLTETVRSMVRTLAAIDPSPMFVLSEANRILLGQVEAGQFVTAIYLLLDPAKGTARVARAGHPPMWCYNGRWFQPDVPQGVPLGSFEQTYMESGFMVGKGDRLLMHTDGLYTRDGQAFFWGHLLESALDGVGGEALPQDIVDHLMAAASDFAHGLVDDDTAIVSVSPV